MAIAALPLANKEAAALSLGILTTCNLGGEKRRTSMASPKQTRTATAYAVYACARVASTTDTRMFATTKLLASMDARYPQADCIWSKKVGVLNKHAFARQQSKLPLNANVRHIPVQAAYAG